MAFQEKKFLDAEGVTHLVKLLDEYPNNQILGSVIDAIEGELAQKYEKPSAGIPASDIAQGVIPDVPSWATAAQKPTYTASEVGALPSDTHIPSTTAELTNDAGFITSSALPTKVSDLTNDAGYLAQHQDISGKANSADLAAVATSGDYADLSNKPTIPTVPVQDVQIDGASILQNGIANVPRADANTYGTAKVSSNLGININPEGFLTIGGATSAVIKAANTGLYPITPQREHEAVFYGLAKAAGDTTQSASSNAVGTYTDEAKTAIQTMLGVPSTSDIPDVPVQDVQVNGTSILQNGIANVPYASSTTVGLGKAGGLGIQVNPQNGEFAIAKATATNIKTGSSDYMPIVSGVQHISVFYGLAKAAGADMAQSDNAVGTYTDEAKAAIQAMLGIDLSSIASQVEIPLVETVSGAAVTITGQPNTRYMCGEVTSISITPPAAGSIDVVFTSGSTVAVLTLPSTVKMPEWFDASTLDTNTVYEILITDGVYGSVMTWAT